MNEVVVERSRPSHSRSPRIPPVAMRFWHESQPIVAREIQFLSAPIVLQVLLGLHSVLHRLHPVTEPWISSSRVGKSRVRFREVAILICGQGQKAEPSTVARGIVAVVYRSPDDGLQFLRHTQQRINPAMADASLL